MKIELNQQYKDINIYFGLLIQKYLYCIVDNINNIRKLICRKLICRKLICRKLNASLYKENVSNHNKHNHIWKKEQEPRNRLKSILA